MLDILIALVQVVALLGMVGITIVLIVANFREYRLRKKVELLQYMIDKGYETENIDISNIK